MTTSFGPPHSGACGLATLLLAVSSSLFELHGFGITMRVSITLLRLPAVTTSVNGLNALALLRSQPNHFDLVLSDVVMPGETPLRRPPHVVISRIANTNWEHCLYLVLRLAGGCADEGRMCGRRHGRLQAAGAHRLGA